MKTLLSPFLLLLTFSAAAQVYPVYVQPQLVPPYSPYLSDYASPGMQNFIVHLRANDLSLSSYRCKLRITIEGVGITLRTKSDYPMPALILEGGGIPQVLYGEDLLRYFHPDALDFSGLTRAGYAKSGRLPEGVYRFTVEVLDYNRGTVVSNAGMTMAWIILNDPPILNLPDNFSSLDVKDPANILFSWTPRHSGSPNAAFTTEYTFRLVEIWPENRNPYDAFLTQLPLVEVTTAQNQIVYGPTDPALIPGRKYAWQVEARDTGGKDLFKNNGLSEVFTFQYGETLAVPENFGLRWAKPTTLSMRWDPVRYDQAEVKYRLQYRPRLRREHHEWYETRTQFTEKTLYHLETNTEYEMRVRTEIPNQESAYTDIRIFKTLPPTADVFVCKDPVAPPPAPANTLPVFPMSVNDTLHAGGYDILVRDVMQADGKYFGSGLAIVPWFNSARVRVTFENIRVNDRFWLVSGSVRSVWSGESRFLLEEQTPLLPGAAPRAGELDITIVEADSLIAVVGSAIASVTKDEIGNIVVTTTDGQQQTLAKGKSYAIVDDTGNGYVVDKQGHVAKTTAVEAKSTASRGQRNYKLQFQFARGDGVFGFDEKKYDALAPFYQPHDDGSYVPWKALSSAQADVIEGHLTSSDVGISGLTFEAGGTQVTPLTSSNGTVKLSLQGRMAGMEEELLALHRIADSLPQDILGKVNLVTYDPIQYNLEIVPVNGATLPSGLGAASIASGLNRIFGQAVVAWQVSVTEGISVSVPETFDTGETGLFSNYTADMKKVINAVGRLRDDTYYLFLVKSASSPSTLGYMPRNRRAGFVFLEPHDGNKDELLKTFAHELGHGAFNLKHTFAEHSLPAGTTDNMMDYSDGTALYKYQWDHIHAPQVVLELFDGDNDGEMKMTLARFETEFRKKLGSEGSFSICEKAGLARGYEVYDRFDFEIAVYAGFLRYWLCQTEKERCGEMNPYACGLTNGLLQELDWITMLESLEDWDMDPKALLVCVMHSFPMNSGPEDNIKLEGILFKCLVGIEISDLTAAIKDFVVSNWEESYYQGQATAFALSLLSPFKAKLLAKLQTLPRYAKKLTSFRLLSKAKDSDELVGISKTLANNKADDLAGVSAAGQAAVDLPAPVGKFRQLIGRNNRTYRAADFWKQSNPAFRVYRSNDGKYIIKHDPGSGRMLFADAENRQFIGFALDEENLIGSDYDKLLKNLKTVHGLPGGARSLLVRGRTINLSSDKANFLFGKYKPNDVPGITGEIGTDDIINELGILKNYSFADEVFELHPGSVHVLNIPDHMPIKAGQTFFDAYNKGFMEMVIMNKDRVNVVFVSDPRKGNLLDQFVVDSGQFTGKPTGFAKEIRYLRERGITNIQSADGSQIDITKISLTDLDWSDWE